MKILALGGSGAFGAYAVRTLVESDAVHKVVVGCRNLGRAADLAELLGPKVSVCRVDLEDPAALRATAGDCDVVLNLTGPAYRYGAAVLDAALDARRPYLDLCDDARAAEALFTRHDRAKALGVTAVAGLGCSAGLTNLAAARAAALLDRVNAIHVVHGGAPGEPLGGIANLTHLFDLVHGDIPIIRNGALAHAGGFSEIAPYDFGEPLGEVLCGLISHPEPVMFKRSFRGLRESTVRLGLLPPVANDFLTVCVAFGLTSEEAIPVRGTQVSPREFLAEYLYRHTGAHSAPPLLGDGPAFAVHVVVEGVRDGSATHLVYKTFEGAGVMTGVPAALGAIWLGEGRIDRPGVSSADQCVEAEVFMGELARLGVRGPQLEPSAASASPT